MLNLLFIGDIVGKSGCDFLAGKLYSIKQKYKIDITVANGENSAEGNGITYSSAEYLLNSGVDLITTGNHAFKRIEASKLLEENEYIIRPANYPEGCAGFGVKILDFGRFSVAFINLMGTTYMDSLDNPFNMIDDILNSIPTPNIFLDFHAEATSDKKAMGHYLAGKVTGVFGTHTHVQTADDIILNNHTAYITDVGMTGAELSVLGITPEIIIQKLKSRLPIKFHESDNPCFLNGVICTFNEISGICTNFQRIIVR